MSIGNVCNREVVVVSRQDSIVEVARLMREYHVGDVVVVAQKEEQKVPVGILTDRDLVVELVAEDVDLTAFNVGDAMSTDLLTAHENEDVIETVKWMRSKGVRRVPVVNDQGGLVGILSVDDVIELLAGQLNDLAKLIGVEQRQEQVHRKD